jgi:hypothetical protein
LDVVRKQRKMWIDLPKTIQEAGFAGGMNPARRLAPSDTPQALLHRTGALVFMSYRAQSFENGAMRPSETNQIDRFLGAKVLLFESSKTTERTMSHLHHRRLDYVARDLLIIVSLRPCSLLRALQLPMTMGGSVARRVLRRDQTKLTVEDPHHL